ncbi:MAG TPA: hypothetical protein VFV73_21325 [Streptosporangiaceae bacterium]|nr:hypothetical protein [Streptosporangiaceae bacterium]
MTARAVRTRIGTVGACVRTVGPAVPPQANGIPAATRASRTARAGEAT